MVGLKDVLKFDPGEPLNDLNALLVPDVAKLVAAYGPGKSGAYDALHPAGKLVSDARINKRWFLCDCGSTGKADTDCALIFPQHRRPTKKTGSLYSLRRDAGVDPGRHPHQKGCPFFTAGVMSTAPKRDTEVYELRKRELPTFLGMFRDTVVPGVVVGQSVPKETESQRQKNEKAREPTLAGVLAAVFEKAGLQERTTHPWAGRKAEMSRLTGALTGMRMFEGAKRTVADYSGQLKNYWGLCNALKSNPGEWGDGLAPHAFLFDVVVSTRKRAKGTHLESADGSTVEVTGRVFRPGAQTPAPWMAIVLVATRPGCDKPEAIQAYLHPLYSEDSLLLVDSNLERETLTLMRACLNGRFARVLKPNTEQAYDSGVCRPDFVVRYNQEMCLVETMGYQNQEYLDGKVAQHEIMSAHAPLFQDSPVTHDDFRAAFQAWLETVDAIA